MPSVTPIPTAYPGFAHTLESSPPFGPSSYSLAAFQPDTVLTAAQLNKLFGFAMSQDQATRTRLLGVGVAAGLQLTATETQLTLTAGCGVSSAGHLLRLEADTTYTHYAPWTPPLAYEGFIPAGTAGIMELLPSGSTNAAKVALSGLRAVDTAHNYVAVLLLDTTVLTNDGCAAAGCADDGQTYYATQRLLLLPYGTALSWRLLPAADTLAVQAGAQPALPPMRRLLRDLSGPALAYEQRQARLRTITDSAAVTLTGALKTAYPQLLRAGLTPPAGAAGWAAQWETQLTAKTAAVPTGTVDTTAQYVYEWLKDLYEAYEEFRQALASPAWQVQAMPAATGFPRHLALGLLVPAAPGGTADAAPPTARHAWRPAPAVSASPAAADRALWLFRRLHVLIMGYNVTTTALPTSATAAAAATAIRITPDRQRPAGFDQRSLPFYYAGAGAATVREFWSYAATRAGQAAFIPSANALAVATSTNTNVADTSVLAPKPLYYQLDRYDFFRVEQIINAPLTGALQQLNYLRGQFNLPFDVVAVAADNYASLVGVPAYPDLQVEFDDLRLQLRADDPDTFDATEEAMQPLALNLSRPQFTAWVSRYTGDDDGGIVKSEDYLLTRTLATRSLLAGRLLAKGTTNGTGQQAQKEIENDGGVDTPLDPATTSGPRLTLLNALNTSYNNRVAALHYYAFWQANPGLEYGAGVPRGGTLVLAYRAALNAPAGTVTEPLVVGTFYLPNRLPGTVTVYSAAATPPDTSTPAVTVTLTAPPLVVRGQEGVLAGTPTGGTYSALAGTKLFNFVNKAAREPLSQPRFYGDQVGKQTVRYTVGSAFKSAEVYIALNDFRIQGAHLGETLTGVVHLPYLPPTSTPAKAGELSLGYSWKMTVKEAGKADQTYTLVSGDYQAGVKPPRVYDYLTVKAYQSTTANPYGLFDVQFSLDLKAYSISAKSIVKLTLLLIDYNASSSLQLAEHYLLNAPTGEEKPYDGGGFESTDDDFLDSIDKRIETRTE